MGYSVTKHAPIAVNELHYKNYLDHVYVVSNDNGTLLEHYRYSAFGEVEIYANNGVRRATSAIDNTILWNSRRYDADTELYNYKYRHYKDDIGRWLGRDPVEEKGGYNLYGFVGNGPIGRWDRFGLTLSRFSRTIHIEQIRALTGGDFGYTGGASHQLGDIPITKIIGLTEYEKNKEKGLCCAKVKKAPAINWSVYQLKPSQDSVGEFVSLDFNFYKLTAGGVQGIGAHEDRRYAVYEHADTLYMKPAETDGAEVTKCGWVCRDLYDAAEAELDEYVDSVQKYVLSKFENNRNTNVMAGALNLIGTEAFDVSGTDTIDAELHGYAHNQGANSLKLGREPE